MDPDEALRELREKMSKMRSLIDDPSFRGNDEDLVDAANRAIDLFDGLDRWMSMSGAPPKDWAHVPSRQA